MTATGSMPSRPSAIPASLSTRPRPPGSSPSWSSSPRADHSQSPNPGLDGRMSRAQSSPGHSCSSEWASALSGCPRLQCLDELRQDLVDVTDDTEVSDLED